jgi:IS5 family transposase
MFRTVGDRPPLWESLLPAQVLRLPEELARVDALLDDPAFFAPFAPYFHPVLGWPSAPVECFLRLMFLKYRYRLGFESLCAEVSDPVSWRRFCRIPLDAAVPHPTTPALVSTVFGVVHLPGSLADMGGCLPVLPRRRAAAQGEAYAIDDQVQPVFEGALAVG